MTRLLQPWRLAGTLVAAAMDCVPRRQRFDAAVLLSRPLTTIVRRTSQFQLLARTGFTSDAEIALHLLLHTLSVNDADYDPRITIDGYERFVREHRRGRGVLLVSPHTPLVLLMLRRFHDDGMEPVVVAPDRALRIAGTTIVAETVQRSTTSLVQIRNRLREGRLVCAMLDRAGHEPKSRTSELDTAFGPIIFAPALLHVASRSAAGVAFCEAHLEGRDVRGRISVAAGTSGAGVEREYTDFISAFMRHRAVSSPLAALERAAM